MSFCPVCGSELKPEATNCPVCGTSVAVYPQPPVNTQPPKKAKKKKKNLGIKITAAVLAVIILAVSGLFIADNIMYKNEIEAEEYITDFPVLKTETDFVVFDEEDFPSTDYSIKVERVLYGGILKSELFKQTKIIIDDTSTDPVYHIDFEKDGEYIITLEDNTDEEPETTLDFSEDTDYEADTDTDENDEDDDDAPSKVVIKVTVDNDDDEAIGSVDLDSKPGDDPVEIPSDEEEPTTDDESDSAPQEYKELIGTYKGSYFAGQGETGLTLTVYMEDEQCKALFDFYNLPGQNNAQSGKYYMDVVYDETSDTYSFNATEWIEKPSTYVFINLKGQLVGDVLSGDSPTRFSVSKATDDNDTTTDDTTNVTGDWVNAYREFLLDGNFQLTYDTIEGRGFALCYIDNDDIPELIVGIMPKYAPHAAGAAVYTYYDGEVVFVCSGGGYGEINYVERENLICSMYTGMGITTIQTYEIANGTGVCIWTGFNDAAGIPESQEPTYKSNEVEVSLEEFKEALDIYCPDERMSSSSDNYYALTEENVYYYVTE